MTAFTSVDGMGLGYHLGLARSEIRTCDRAAIMHLSVYRRLRGHRGCSGARRQALREHRHYRRRGRQWRVELRRLEGFDAG